ncbi:MAG: hypothetical protein QM537_09085, partial [Candidatus Symbiobacter sp.]|nr:hypothetical protein [Candidatus Symbiobacter sp.]
QAGIRLQSESGNPPGVLLLKTPGGLPDGFIPLCGKNPRVMTLSFLALKLLGDYPTDLCRFAAKICG